MVFFGEHGESNGTSRNERTPRWHCCERRKIWKKEFWKGLHNWKMPMQRYARRLQNTRNLNDECRARKRNIARWWNVCSESSTFPNLAHRASSFTLAHKLNPCLDTPLKNGCAIRTSG